MLLFSKLGKKFVALVLLSTAIIHHSYATDTDWRTSNVKGSARLRSYDSYLYSEEVEHNMVGTSPDPLSESIAPTEQSTDQPIFKSVFISSPAMNGKVFLFPWNLKERKGDYFYNEGYCKSNNAEMVSLQSKEENQFFYEWVKRAGKPYGKIHPGVWLASIIENKTQNIVWLNGDPAEYKNWMSGEPNVGPFTCLSMGWNNAAHWHDYECTDKTFNVVCQIKPVPTDAAIPSEKRKRTATQTGQQISKDVFISSPAMNGKVFLFPWDLKDRKGDYFYNEGYCKSNNAEMVSIQSKKENQFFYEWVKRAGKPYGKIHPGVWLASIIENKTQNIVWLNGDPAEYKNWMSGEPNVGPFTCLSMGWNNASVWHDYECTDKTFNVVCQRKIIQSQ